MIYLLLYFHTIAVLKNCLFKLLTWLFLHFHFTYNCCYYQNALFTRIRKPFERQNVFLKTVKIVEQIFSSLQYMNIKQDSVKVLCPVLWMLTYMRCIFTVLFAHCLFDNYGGFPSITSISGFILVVPAPKIWMLKQCKSQLMSGRPVKNHNLFLR